MSIDAPEHESFSEAIDPNNQAKKKQNLRWFIIAGAAALVGLVFVYTVMFKPVPGAKKAAGPDKETVQRINAAGAVANMQPVSPQAANVELQSQVNDVQSEFQKTQAENEQLKAQLQQAQLQASADQQRAFTEGLNSRTRPTTEMLPVRSSGAPGDAAQFSQNQGRASPTLQDPQGAPSDTPPVRQKRTLLVVNNTPVAAPATSAAPIVGSNDTGSTSVTKTAGSTAVSDTLKIYDSREFVPPNSYATAKVLVGVDMTTGVGGQSDPKPVLFRIESNAIGVGLTGKFQNSNLKGCLVNGAAYGELSSEKVYIKLQRITCEVNDHQFMTAQVEGFATHLGKAGIRGPVVSREGGLTTKAMIAGMFQGLGQALNTNVQRQTTSIGSTSDGSALLGTQPLTDKQIQQATVGSGVANAANTLAEYLIKRAEQYQPVIEMQTGIQVELVFQTGFRFTTSPKN